MKDYLSLLQLAKGHSITEIVVEPEVWLAGKTLAELSLQEEGVLVLGIQRFEGNYVAAPTGQSQIQPYDTIVLYGRAESLQELSQRISGRMGDEAHEKAVRTQEGFLSDERKEEREYQDKKRVSNMI